MRVFASNPKTTKQTTSARVDRARAGPGIETARRLQHSIGNQATQRLLRTKLAISEPGDIHEQEADRVADQVMALQSDHAFSSAPPSIQRFSGESNGRTEAAPASVEQTLAGSDSSLEPALRLDMERRFGHDFSQIRVHSGALAEQSARDVNAQAYTVRHNLVFGVGRYAPETNEGRRLIVHELTHAIQQSASSVLRIDRFGEGEHKELGNRTTTKFPYFAKLATDEVALRSSPKGPRPDNKFTNLVASLRNDVRVLVVGNVGKWMRVMVQSGTALDGKTHATIDAAGLTGYISEKLLVKESGVYDQQLSALPGLTLTYGDFTSLGGDHFAKFEDLENKAKSKGGPDLIKKFVDVVEGRRKGEFEDPNTIDKEWAERYKNLAFDNIPHFSEGGTALETWKKQHYSALMAATQAGYLSDPNALQRAYAMNGFADHFLTDSFSSGHVRTPRDKIIQTYQNFFDQNLDSILSHIYASVADQIVAQIISDYPNRAWIGQNITGTDFCGRTRTAANEIKTKVEEKLKGQNLQQQDVKKLLTQYVGGAVSKILHDDENKAGLQVTSKQHPEGWKAFGDSYLRPSPTDKADVAAQKTKHEDYIIEAVQVSKNEVIQAFNLGIDFKADTSGAKLEDKIKPLVYPTSKIEDYIPKADAKASPLPGWEIDSSGGNAMGKTIEDRLTALVQKYLTDDELEKMIKEIPATEEVEIRGPNIDARPRDAFRVVLLRFRNDPASFIREAAKGPKELEKAILKTTQCR